MKKLFVKTLSITAFMLSLTTCHSMEFLSPRGREAATKFKHVEFVVTDGMLTEIKLKTTPELLAYRKEIGDCIVRELNAILSEKYPEIEHMDIEQCCKQFPSIEDSVKPSLDWDYIGLIVRTCISNVNSFINSLSSSMDALRPGVVDGVTSLLRTSLTKYRNDLFLHFEQFPVGYVLKKMMYDSFFLAYNKDNLLNFSEPISSELFSALSSDQKNAYGFTSQNIRIITADSILIALGRLKIFGHKRETFYRQLLIQSENSDSQLIAMYEKLFDDAGKINDILIYGDLIGNSCVSAPINIEKVKLYKTAFVSNIKDSLFPNSRQTLVLFLASHEYVLLLSALTQHPITNLVLSFTCTGGLENYPQFDLSCSPDYTPLVLPPSGGVSYFYGYNQGSHDAPALFRHELRHAINKICGLRCCAFDSNSDEFSKGYIDCPFLRDLLFPDIDKIRIELKDFIQAFLSNLSEEEKPAFLNSIREYYKITEDGTAPIDAISFSMTMDLISLWHSPEEVHNIIGLQLLDGTLYVNQLADIASSLEKKEAFRWLHVYATSAEQNIEEFTAWFADINARMFMNEFCKKYKLATSPLNHPKEMALNTLLKLHGDK